jgi:DNA damage-binding protein 1|eukprot:COSAG02_NODE_314_length_24915_cov_18.575596_26_plen_93_part_00
MTKIVQGVGGLSHTEWRSFHNERKTQECRGFIDGDLVEMFLDLPRPKMEEVVKLITDSTGSFGSVRGGGEDMSGITVEDLLREVEEVQRIHT